MESPAKSYCRWCVCVFLCVIVCIFAAPRLQTVTTVKRSLQGNVATTLPPPDLSNQPLVSSQSTTTMMATVATATPVPSPSSPLKKVVMIESSRTFWENGYIVKEYLKGYNVTVQQYDAEAFNRNSPAFANLKRHVPVLNPPVVLTVHAEVTSCADFEWMLQALKPALTFLLSNELGGKGCHQDAAGTHSGLVLRHYSAIKYNYKQYPNVHQVMLGSRDGMMDHITDATWKNLIPAPKRRNVWAFSGAKKSDREEMVAELKPLTPNEWYWETKTPAETADLMLNATFVPNGRGWVSLECFRLFEASRLGAIPVVVGSTTEVEVSFSYHLGYMGKLPPWLYASSWSEAREKMEKLYHFTDALIAKQNAVLDFYAAVSEAAFLKARQAIDG